MDASARIGRWEALGVLWIVAIGIPLHFLYSSTGWEGVVWLAPINESTWEHFKLAFWPALSWAGIEWLCLPQERRSLWTAKLAGLSATPILIAGIYYGCRALLGAHFPAVDIGNFIVAVAVGQWTGFRVWTGARRWSAAPLLIALFAALFILFSFRPPELPLFEEPARLHGMH